MCYFQITLLLSPFHDKLCSCVFWDEGVNINGFWSENRIIMQDKQHMNVSQTTGREARRRSNASRISCWLAALLFLLLPTASNHVQAARPDSATRRKNAAEADAFFTNSVIVKLQIEIPEADIESLLKKPRDYVKGVIREGGMVYTNVSIHLKGSAGSFRPIDAKPALTINLKPADTASTFHGLKKFHLNNCVQEPTYLSEWICGHMFRTAGVPTSRSVHALVELNGRKLGLYVLLESMNKEFLERYFDSANGNLYGQSQNADITDPLERMEGKGENIRADLKALAAAAQEHDVARLYPRLQETLNIDAFLTFMAMEVMLCHWDGYTFSTHNYRVYHNPGDNKNYFFSHDFDLMMMEPKSPIHPGAHGIISRDILKIPETRAGYRSRFSSLFTNVFNVPALTIRIDELLLKITPEIESYDPVLARGMKAKSEELKDRILQRALSIEEQLKLPPPENLVLQVNVMDADTLMLVPRCTVIAGFRDDANKLAWDRTHLFRALRGTFILDVAEARLPQIPTFFKFEAEGYLPSVVSYQLSTNAEDAVFTVALKKGGRVSGSVRLPDEKPARGAEVVMVMETSTPILSQADFVRQPSLSFARVLDRGRFAFPPDPEAQAIVAAHENGFIEFPLDDLSEKTQIDLQPWSCVEGSISDDAANSPSFKVTLTTDFAIPGLFAGFYSGKLQLNPGDFTAELSQNHPFSFDKVPPGDLFLWRSIQASSSTNSDSSAVFYMGQQITTKSGVTNRIEWNRPERVIDGCINLPDVAKEPQDRKQNAKRRSMGKTGLIRLTDPSKDTSLGHEFFFNLDENNRFRLSTAETGKFQVELRIFAPPMTLGIKSMEWDLPGPSASTNTVDFGRIELNAIHPARIGDVAPSFNIKDLDGKSMALADFRGQYVLLHFWASWSTPQFTLLPALKAIVQDSQTNPGLVTIGLNLDKNPDTARRYVRRNSMTWRQASLGEWFRTKLPSEYGATAIPFAVLVGPDGRIIAQDIDFKRLPERIKKLRSSGSSEKE